MAERGVNVSALLQDFVRHSHGIVQRHRRTPVVWEELLQTELANDTIVLAWRSDKTVRSALDRGLRVVHAHSSHFYLDWCGAAAWDLLTAQRSRWMARPRAVVRLSGPSLRPELGLTRTVRPVQGLAPHARVRATGQRLDRRCPSRPRRADLALVRADGRRNARLGRLASRGSADRAHLARSRLGPRRCAGSSARAAVPRRLSH